MEKQYNLPMVFKAISDETRMKIVEILSCGEMCACDILEYFQITQPTLSYHMKILTESGLVVGRKEGSWMIYNINIDLVKEVMNFWNRIMGPDENCICKTVKETGKCE